MSSLQPFAIIGGCFKVAARSDRILERNMSLACRRAEPPAPGRHRSSVSLYTKFENAGHGFTISASYGGNRCTLRCSGPARACDELRGEYRPSGRSIDTATRSGSVDTAFHRFLTGPAVNALFALGKDAAAHPFSKRNERLQFRRDGRYALFDPIEKRAVSDFLHERLIPPMPGRRARIPARTPENRPSSRCSARRRP
jgi:hypothetical protein